MQEVSTRLSKPREACTGLKHLWHRPYTSLKSKDHVYVPQCTSHRQFENFIIHVYIMECRLGEFGGPDQIIGYWF